MNMSIEKMLSHVYEIEGLMLVTRRLGEENTPQVITNKIQRKVKELAEMCGVAFNSPEEQPKSEVEPKPEEQPIPEEPAQQASLPEDDYDANETWQHDNGEEFKEVFELNYEEPQHEVPVADREPDEDIEVEFIMPENEPETEKPASTAPTPPPFHAAPETQETPVVPESPAIPETPEIPETPDPDPDVLPEASDEPDITVEFIEADDETVPEPEDEMPIPPVPTEFPEPEATAAPLRVDEKLQRNLSKDIRKAFSINDRFRFQRELFAGSANAMDTAIEHIEVMTSYGNAELYFYSQLNWDRENEVVKDFMTIVRNHFQH